MWDRLPPSCSVRSLTSYSFVLSWLCWICSGSSPAFAQAGAAPVSRATLTWERGLGAEQCISPTALTQAIDTQLGYAAFTGDGALRVRGHVARTASASFRASVEFENREGELLGRREVEAKGSDCKALSEAVALVMALAIETHLVELSAEAARALSAESSSAEAEQASEATPAPAVTEPEAAPPVEAAPEKPAKAQPVRREQTTLRIVRSGSTFGLVLAVGGGVGTGIMPAASGEGSVTVGFRTPSLFSVELSALFFPYGRVPTSEGRAEFRAGYAELRGCAPLYRSKLYFDACLGLWNGVLHASGVGFSARDFARVTPLSGATLQLRGAWDFWARYFMRVSAGAGVPFVRDRFVVESSTGKEVLLHRLDKVLSLVQFELGVRLR